MFYNIKTWAKDNGYTLLDKIPSGWDRYGDGIPSVTTILSLLRDSSFEHVKRMHPEALDKACKRGTQIHKDAEDFFNGDSEAIHKQILKFHILYDVVILDKEFKWKKDGIQGTIDVIAQGSFKDCCIVNIDYKSSMNKSKKYFLQMGGYKYGNGYNGALLYLSDTKFKLEWMPPEYLDLFIELKDYFFYLKNIGQLEFTLEENVSQQIRNPYEDMMDIV